MILRRSQKLNAKIKAGKLSQEVLDANPYAGWSCHLFTADRTQYIIMSNTASLYSCVMFGKGITDDGQFVGRALSTIREFMEDDGQAFAYQRFIAPATQVPHADSESCFASGHSPRLSALFSVSTVHSRFSST